MRAARARPRLPRRFVRDAHRRSRPRDLPRRRSRHFELERDAAASKNLRSDRDDLPDLQQPGANRVHLDAALDQLRRRHEASTCHERTDLQACCSRHGQRLVVDLSGGHAAKPRDHRFTRGVGGPSRRATMTASSALAPARSVSRFAASSATSRLGESPEGSSPCDARALPLRAARPSPRCPSANGNCETVLRGRADDGSGRSTPSSISRHRRTARRCSSASAK